MSAIRKDQKLYVMKNTVGLYKIGISIDPYKRANDISNNSGFKTEVIKVYCTGNVTAIDVEQNIHKKFKAFRKEGEWFYLSDKDIGRFDTIVQSAIKCCEYVDKTNSHILPSTNKRVKCEGRERNYFHKRMVSNLVASGIKDMSSLLESYPEALYITVQEGKDLVIRLSEVYCPPSMPIEDVSIRKSALSTHDWEFCDVRSMHTPFDFCLWAEDEQDLEQRKNFIEESVEAYKDFYNVWMEGI